MKLALDEAKIDMPYDTKVHLLHDQTEETDGDRSQQREGWPAKKDGKNPKPRWKKELEDKEKMTNDREEEMAVAEENQQRDSGEKA